MPRVGFENTIPVFERTKTVHALDCAASVIGEASNTFLNFFPVIIRLGINDVLTRTIVRSEHDIYFISLIFR
jgi:hypothetical protein